MHTQFGKYIISIILGLGLASIFRKSCEKRNCLVFKAPPLTEIKKNVYQHNHKCYKFTENSVSCNNNKRQVEFA